MKLPQSAAADRPQEPCECKCVTQFAAKTDPLVEDMGLEPMTSCMPCRERELYVRRLSTSGYVIVFQPKAF